MSRLWPRWRHQDEDDEARTDEARNIEAAKEEAVSALHESYEQLQQIKAISSAHEPVRQELKKIRQRNQFAAGFIRVIKEGR